MVSRLIVVVFLVIMGCKQPFSDMREAVALPLPLQKKQESIVFITGLDKGENRYYGRAKNYFAEKGMLVVETLFSLEEIMLWLNQKAERRIAFDEIHIVSHSNAWLGMSLKTTKNGERVTLGTLQEAKRKNRLPKMKHDGITEETKIIFHSCGLGNNLDLLDELKRIFLNAGLRENSKSKIKGPQIYASTFFNVFGGKFAGHYLAKPYYGFYPTGESKGPLFLSEEFKKKYPEIQIDWFAAVKTRGETQVGEPYSYKFNIPINWELTFEDSADMPNLDDREVILDFISESSELAEILVELDIPLEKYRWMSEVKGNKLLIKGKTTVLCVLAPILHDTDSREYRKPMVDDPSLYQIL